MWKSRHRLIIQHAVFERQKSIRALAFSTRTVPGRCQSLLSPREFTLHQPMAGDRAIGDIIGA